jgi:trehalose-phosphatase
MSVQLPPQSDGTALADFARRLAATGRAVLLLDYDGTLAPFEVDPSAVRPWPGLCAALDALLATGRARIVVVTGRYLGDAPPLLGTREQPEIWGSHGRERLLPDGRYEITPAGAAAAAALAKGRDWAPAIEAAGGRCETKPGSIAFHWRGADIAQIARIRALVSEAYLVEKLDAVLDLCPFDGGLELRARDTDKGTVVEAILAEADPDTPVAYLGDDVTDEDAFRALRGRGLGVLVRPERRRTAADTWVRPPEGLLALLRSWHGLIERAGE